MMQKRQASPTKAESPTKKESPSVTKQAVQTSLLSFKKVEETIKMSEDSDDEIV
jgi:hypothetical protein